MKLLHHQRLASTSGTNKIPRSVKIRVASGVVGPLAASTIISALISFALSSVIWLEIAYRY